VRQQTDQRLLGSSGHDGRRGRLPFRAWLSAISRDQSVVVGDMLMRHLPALARGEIEAR
jgi:hypothetical protein